MIIDEVIQLLIQKGIKVDKKRNNLFRTENKKIYINSNASYKIKDKYKNYLK